MKKCLLFQLLVFALFITDCMCALAANVTISPASLDDEAAFLARDIAPVLNVIAGGSGTVTGRNGVAMAGTIRWGSPTPVSGAQITYTGVSRLPGDPGRSYTVARFDGIYVPAGTGGTPVTLNFRIGGWQVSALVLNANSNVTNLAHTLANFHADGSYRPHENARGPFGNAAGALNLNLSRSDPNAVLVNGAPQNAYPNWWYDADGVGNGSSLEGAAYTVTITYTLTTPLKSLPVVATDRFHGNFE